MRHLPRLSLALCLFAVFTPTAHADTVSIFTLSPDAAFQTYGSLTGQIAIDITSGQFVSADLAIGDIPDYPLTVITDTDYGTFGPYSGAFIQDDFDLPNPQGIGLIIPGSSLIGYAGGPLCTLANFCVPPDEDPFGLAVSQFGGDGMGDPLVSGSLLFDSSYQTGPTPEPPSLLLLATGLVCATATLLRRRTNATNATDECN